MTTIRYLGPPSPGYNEAGDWIDDLGLDLPHLPAGRVRAEEAVTLDGWAFVPQDPEDPAAYAPDAILLDAPTGQRIALPRTLWAAEGEPAATERVADIEARVGTDAALARIELDAERRRPDGQQRVTLIRALEKVIAGAEQTTATSGTGTSGDDGEEV